MVDPREKWNKRWQDKAGTADWQVDPWLEKVFPLLPKGTALDVACGLGHNSLYLAENGFSVTAVDVSETALKLLNEEGQKRHLIINSQQIDLEGEALLPDGPFDLLLNFFYLHRPLLPQELAIVKPGGIAVIRTFSRIGAGQTGKVSAEMSLAAGELLEIFSGWKILLHEEGVEPSKKGGTLAGIVAQRPKPSEEVI